MGALFLLAPRPTDAAPSSFLTPLILLTFLAATGVRLVAELKAKSARKFDLLWIVVDFTLLHWLIYSFHVQYSAPAGIYLKAPTANLAYFLILIRAMQLDVRSTLISGAAAVLGWGILTVFALNDPGAQITRSFTTYMTSSAVLIGAQIEHIIGLCVATGAMALGALSASRDGLTGLGNRRHFSSQLDRGGEGAAVILVRISNLDDLSSFFGQDVADAAVVETTDRLRTIAGPWGQVWRLEDATLAMTHGGLSDNAAFGRALDRLEIAVQQPLRNAGGFTLAVQIGGAMNDATQSLAVAYREALTALACAETKGTRSTIIYSAELGQRARDHIAIERGLRGAAERGELELHYQPVVGVRDRQFIGVEALLRWRCPNKGLMSPGVFISVAEATGQIVEIGAWVIGQATRDQAAWRAQGLDIVVNVNVSPKQITEWRSLERALTCAQRAGARLKIEIIEGALTENDPRLQARLEGMRNLCDGLAIDDFGAGHSSFGRLTQMPFTTLKIDKSLTDAAMEPKGREALVALAHLSRALQMDAVVEGVETAEQAFVLEALGFQYAQGYLFARPMIADAIPEFAGAGDCGAREQVSQNPWTPGREAQQAPAFPLAAAS